MNSFASSSRPTVWPLILAALIGAVSNSVAYHLFPQRAMNETAVVSRRASVPEVLVAGSEEEQVVRVVQRSLPAVVSIDVSRTVSTTRTSFFDEDQLNLLPPSIRRRIGGGSGFFVSSDGLLVTNRHVVDDRTAEYTVTLQDKKQHSAKIIAVDPTLDLAILKIEHVSGMPVLELGDSDAIQVGQTVIAIGNALAEFQNSVTKGVISGKNRRLVAGGVGGAEVLEEALQTDAPISPGNSGGPLLDVRGQVVGVNTAVSSDGQSLGFAIPINSVKRALESVQKSGRIVRPWLGVRYFMIDAESAERDRLPVAYGALISRGALPRDPAVVPGSPADKAGLKENDIILEVDGKKLGNDRSLATALGSFTAGDKVQLKILRDGKERQIELTLDERTNESR